MKKAALLALLIWAGWNTRAQDTKQLNQNRSDTANVQHPVPRHRHEHTDNTKKDNKADTAKAKLNKEKNQGNVPQPGK